MSVAMPTFPSGHIPSADEFAALLPLEAAKSVDETVTSSTTFQNDDALFLTGMDPAGIYRIRLYVLFNATNATNGGFKTQLTLPTGATASNWAFDWAGGSKGNTTGANVTGITCTTSVDRIEYNGRLVMGGSVGTVMFQWAQNSSSANGTVVKAGSFMYGRRVG